MYQIATPNFTTVLDHKSLIYVELLQAWIRAILDSLIWLQETVINFFNSPAFDITQAEAISEKLTT